MFKNYLKIAVRNILKHRGYSAINLFGLVIGLASFIIIMLYVYDELSYDRFHADADRIHRVVYDMTWIDGDGAKMLRTGTPSALKDAMLGEIPEIEQVTRLQGSWDKIVLSNENYTFYGNSFLYVDNSFFDVFSFPFIQGGVHAALTNEHSIVLTESCARKFFGDDDALGQMLLFDQNGPLQVTGIMKMCHHNLNSNLIS